MPRPGVGRARLLMVLVRRAMLVTTESFVLSPAPMGDAGARAVTVPADAGAIPVL